MSYHHIAHTERRAFFKNFGLRWAKEIKKAQKNLDFPDTYHGFSFKSSQMPNGHGNNLLAMPNFPTVALETGTLYTLEKIFDNNKILNNFIQEHAIDCVLCVRQPFAIENTTQIIYQPDVAHLNTPHAPSLLLFENNVVGDVVHQIPSLFSQLPPGSDVYIGNIKNDLSTRGTSPTKERVELFLKELRP